MNYIEQEYLKSIGRFLRPGKVLVLYGTRRVGKTTLIRKFLEDFGEEYLFVSGDDINIQEQLSSLSLEKLTAFIGNKRLLAIDEAQNISKIGQNLKILVDAIPNLKIIATGSSSFELAKDVGEPLTGRKFTLKLYPLSQLEIMKTENTSQTVANLELRLIYGSYPEVITENDNFFREKYLEDLVESYLFKDILTLEGIRNADKLKKLLQLIAFQVGKEVSYHELGNQLSLNKITVEKYLDLLEKVFIITHRTGFTRNLRKEISKTKRFYFLDNGIRNALIKNFNSLNIRNDVGALWENYLISERIKKLAYTFKSPNSYFWRTYDQQEIDLIEEMGGEISAFEFKWREKKVKVPGGWYKNYPEAKFNVIDRMNYLDFIA